MSILGSNRRTQVSRGTQSQELCFFVFSDFPGFHYTVIALKSRIFVLKTRTEFG
jgi:hypothetical protein